ncbi:MAG: OsmC family protein [Candidatus Schekmanbacteria bacterium]|nr:OsmC family protein [Candidatus Schekmanbacteria bacterium]
MKIIYNGEKQFAVKTRDHEFVVDLPEQKGGKNEGPTPPEIFAASLGTCIGVYVTSYCNAKGINCKGLSLDVNWSVSDEQERIDKIEIEMTMPDEDYKEREKAILKTAGHCLIHNTLHTLPDIKLSIKPKK